MTDIVEQLRRDATCTSHHEAAAEIEWLRGERNRLANDLAQAHRDILPWLERVWILTNEKHRLRSALKDAAEGLREAGAIYGADAAVAALGDIK